MAFKTTLTYKKRPIVRFKDDIYYGDLGGKYILKLKVLSFKKQGTQSIADKVKIELLDADIEGPESERVMRHAERNGLFNALDIGKVWLDSALSMQ